MTLGANFRQAFPLPLLGAEPLLFPLPLLGAEPPLFPLPLLGAKQSSLWSLPFPLPLLGAESLLFPFPFPLLLDGTWVNRVGIGEEVGEVSIGTTGEEKVWISEEGSSNSIAYSLLLLYGFTSLISASLPIEIFSLSTIFPFSCFLFDFFNRPDFPSNTVFPDKDCTTPITLVLSNVASEQSFSLLLIFLSYSKLPPIERSSR